MDSLFSTTKLQKMVSSGRGAKERSFSTTKMQKTIPDGNKLQKLIPEGRRGGKESFKKHPSLEREPSLSIYAELSRRDYNKILNDELEICVPYGIEMEHGRGSRCLFFECSDVNSRQLLIDGLEASGIPWQED